MESEINLQKYFDLITMPEYRGTIARNFDETYRNMLIDIERLLNFDLLGMQWDNFSHAEIIKEIDEIDCVLSIGKPKDAKLYIEIAKRIADFFNEDFKYSAEDLNIGLPTRSELRAKYQLENDERKLIYSAGIKLSNELTEIRFTIYKT